MIHKVKLKPWVQEGDTIKTDSSWGEDFNNKQYIVYRVLNHDAAECKMADSATFVIIGKNSKRWKKLCTTNIKIANIG